MGSFSRSVISLFSRAAAEQGGVISGDNPTAYNTSDPFRLWVIQVVIIVIFTQLFALLLGRIRQPRVISEVIGGVILGPTILGRIPNFSHTIFPTQSVPYLTLTADIGLVFFLFLVGLEIDTRVIKRNARASFLISTASLIVPLGVGAGIAVPIYHEFIDPSINKGYFILFVAVAVGITAFPVLCRILTEVKLLETTVGVVVLSAGVGNDIVDWILLALTVALVNASTGLTALWVLLAATGFVLFLLFPVRWAFTWLARKTGSFDNGQPTPFMMTLTLLLVLVSAFFTDIIGIHPIFGGFLAGLVIPHEGGFAIAIVEKLEDLISIILLPIYFTISGINTNLGTLNNGITWAYVVILCILAFTSKFLGSSIVAYMNGFTIRESGAIGTLMSCKGLVELIVLNVGLQAGILDTRTFSMFVLVALVLTFITTPLTLLWYPPKVRVYTRSTAARTAPGMLAEDGSGEEAPKTNFTVVLQKVDHLPSIMTLTQLIQSPHVSSVKTLNSSMTQSSIGHNNTVMSEKEKSGVIPNNIKVNALRLMELTERTSAVLRSQEASTLVQSDSVVSVFRTFGHLHRIPVSATLSVVPHDEFSSTVSRYANETGSQMVIIPWNSSPLGTNAALEEAGQATSSNSSTNPFEALFSKSDKASSVLYSQFVRKIFAESPSDVCLYVDRGISNADSGYDNRIFFPFFGGPDDRLAMSFVLQICANPSIRATIVRIITKRDEAPLVHNNSLEKLDQNINANIPNIHSISAFADTVYDRSAQTQQISDMADNLVWNRTRGPSINRSQAAIEALERITFSEVKTSRPLHTVIELARAESKKTVETWENLLVVVGRGRRMATECHQDEMKQIMQEFGVVPTDFRKALGEVASAFVSAKIPANLLVLQATLSSASAFV